MNDVLSAFNERVKEVESYLEFLKLLDKVDTKLCQPGSNKHHPIKADEIKRLKASAFLIIYNLMESTIRDGFSYVYETISNEGCGYKDVSEGIRKLWLSKVFREAGSDAHVEIARQMIAQIINKEPLVLEKGDIRISGNVDARKIRELCETHGVSARVHHRALGGAELLTVKNHRNNLAHGSMSFSECGRMYTLEDIERISRQVVIYLRGILKNVSRFIEKREYANAD